MPTPIDSLQGTPDLHILQTLDLEAMHGWGIGNRLADAIGMVLDGGMEVRQ